AVGHDAGHMPEVMLESVQAGAIALADEAGESLAPLMRGQVPGRAVTLTRQIDEGSEPPVQPDDERPAGRDLRRAAVDDAPASEGEPELRSACLSAKWLRQMMQDLDGAQDGCRRRPEMRRSGVSAGGLEDPPAEIAKGFGAIGGWALFDAIGDGDETRLLNPVDQQAQLPCAGQRRVPGDLLALDRGKAERGDERTDGLAVGER
ncbi:hypothetical protein KXV85_002291, partial [Aspergillus fumigatus]